MARLGLEVSLLFKGQDPFWLQALDLCEGPCWLLHIYPEFCLQWLLYFLFFHIMIIIHRMAQCSIVAILPVTYPLRQMKKNKTQCLNLFFSFFVARNKNKKIWDIMFSIQSDKVNPRHVHCALLHYIKVTNLNQYLRQCMINVIFFFL